MNRLVLLACALFLQLVAARLPAAAGTALLWITWIATPGLLWWGGWRELARPERWIPAGLLQLLTVAGLGALSGLPSDWLPWTLTFSWLLPLAWRRPRAEVPAPRLSSRGVLFICVLLAAWMASRPPSIALYSDAPGHLAGVRDALAQNRLRPIDLGAGAFAGAHDPRFGVLHGLYAAIADYGDWDPESVLLAAPIVFAPLWYLAHANFFALFLAGRWLPLLIALLFSIAGFDGRLYGNWGVAYPGNFGLACAAMAMATLWRERRTGWRPGVGEGLLAASAFVHPFAWWGSCVVLLHAAAWRALTTRTLRRASVATALRCLALGLAALMPVLLARGDAAAGPHSAPVDVIHIGDALYFCDPFRVMRWAGALAPWLLFWILLGGGSILRRPEGALLIAAPLALWTVAFDPFVQPWLYPLVGYLSERLGRLGYAELVASVLIARPWVDRYRPRRRGARLWLFAVALLGLSMLWRSIGWASLVLRADPVQFPGADVHVVDDVVPALDVLGDARLLADPRTSYAISARRGGRYALLPVAHASPNDRQLEARLASYRRLLDPYADPARMREALARLDSPFWLVHAGLESWAREEEFGFVPDGEAQARLLERLRGAGNVAVAEGSDWALFATEALEFGRPPLAQDCMLLEEREPIAVGSRFALVALQPVQRELMAGQSLEIELVYRWWEGPERSEHPDFERVHLRLEGEMPELPDALQPVSKLVRKLLIERSGRSERRFGRSLVPFGGAREPETWATEYACERVSVRVPAGTPPGEYGIQVTIHGGGWRPSYDLRDLLSDRDRYSAVSVAYVEIVDSATGIGSSAGETP